MTALEARRLYPDAIAEEWLRCARSRYFRMVIWPSLRDVDDELTTQRGIYWFAERMRDRGLYSDSTYLKDITVAIANYCQHRDRAYRRRWWYGLAISNLPSPVERTRLRTR